MSTSISADSNSGTARLFAFPWLAAFVALKFVSAYAATWSWWWLLMPAAPVLATIFKALKVF